VSAPSFEPNGFGQRVNRAVVLGPVLAVQALVDVARSVRDLLDRRRSNQ
jgi:hypothetical protein